MLKGFFRHITLSFYLSLGIITFCHSQNQDYIFTYYSIEDGLAHNHCRSMHKDSQGFMWFGTENGLSRYDGQHFKTFRHLENDKNSISGNWINDIVEDKQGNLWIATMREGLCKYDIKSGDFNLYNLNISDNLNLPKDELNCLYIDSQGDLWYGTYRHGFGRFNQQNRTFENYNLNINFTNPRNAWEINSVSAIAEDKFNHDILWIGGIRHGLYRFNKKTKQITQFINPYNKFGSGIHSVFMQNPNELWLGYWGLGIVKFNINNQTWKVFLPDKKKFEKGDGYSNICIDIKKKSKKEFWIASGRDGLGIFNLQTEKFYFIDPLKNLKTNINQGFVSQILVSKKDGIWIRDGINGIFQIDPSKQLFKFVSTKAIKQKSRIGLNSANDFEFDPTDSLYYVATGQGDGLYIYDKNFNLLKTASSSRASPYTYQQFTDILIDNKRRIWILDWLQNDLLKYNKRLNICEPFPLKEFNDFPKNSFNYSALLKDNKDNIWIGTNYGGLLKFNPDTKSLKQYIGTNPDIELTSKATISNLLLDNKGRIWISTIYYGIYVFDTITEKFIHYLTLGKSNQGLAQNRVHTLAQDKNGMIWAGLYTKGIQIINPDKSVLQEINLLTYSNGLENENIVNIISDINNNMWVQTEGGLFNYNYETRQFIKFSYKEGYLDYLNPYGLKSLNSGEICIGVSEGFYVFHPDKLYKNILAPNVVFTGINLGSDNNETIEILNSKKGIKLPYKDNFFTINFAALNFQIPSKNNYAYKLEGIDPDWVYCGNRNYASYTNINEGQYIFKIKASNNDLIWNENAETLKIIITPPWYRSIWAYLLYLIVLVSIIYSFYLYQKRKWKLQTQLQLEHEEAKRLRELDAAKSKIFTNITHEFRTPLTVILGIVDILKNKSQINIKQNLNIIKRNGNSLLQLINQLLELSKIETGNIKTEMIHCDIVGYLGYLTESFHSLANKKGIHLNFYSEQEQINMDFDPEKIERIISNLVSNAIKFTPEYGKILVISGKKIIDGKEYIEIKIRDNGKGISEENQKHIFDRFYQVDSGESEFKEGTGIGLALVYELVKLFKGNIEVKSALNKGTTFSIILPIKHNAKQMDFPKILSGIDEESNKFSNTDTTINLNKNEEKPLILIIEDNKDVIYYLKNILQNNYNIKVAYNGQQGIDKATNAIPDLIISDVMMPEKNGFEVCQTLKTEQITSHIPIILLTAKATAQDRLEGFSKGADAYLNKPFNQKELEIRIKKLLENRRKLQEYYNNQNKPHPKTNIQETQFLEKLYKIIDKNIHDEMFDVNHLSRAMNMSRSQLNRKLKALINTSPALLIRKIRLKKAYRLITETDIPISDIAFDLGFSSSSYFSYSFSEKYGISPSELRSDKNENK